MFEKIVSLLENYTETPRERITKEATLQGDLELNSLDIVNLVVAFEEAFDISINDEDIRSFVTVGDIVDYIGARVDSSS